MIIWSFVVGICFTFFLKWIIQRKKSPPGPIGLPIVGYYPFLGSNQMKKILRFASESGDVMKINILGSEYYFLNTLPLIKDAMIAQGNTLSGRPIDEFNLYTFTFGKTSVINAQGLLWATHQKFIVRGMSALGMGKSSLEPKIHQLCEAMISNVKIVDGDCYDFIDIFTNYASNIISMFLHGEYYDIDDPVYINLRNQVYDFYLSVRDFDAFLTGNIFYFIMKMRGNSLSRLAKVKKEFKKYVDAIFEKRMLNCGHQNNADLLDMYFEKLRDEEGNKPNSNQQFFDLETLKNNWFMMFVVGTDTSSTTLYHAICLMIKYPDVQFKVQTEVDNMIGKDGVVTLKDRIRLNYTQAVFAEILRFSCVVPFGMYHSNTKETTIGGYKIPKRSKIITNLCKVSRDAKHFKYPNQFEPRNFLDENGIFVNNEANMPFLIGKRMCLGAALANAELFIAFVTLLQRFKWQPSDNEPIEYHPYDGVVRTLKNFKAKAVQR